jgi:hypothetical protein
METFTISVYNENCTRAGQLYQESIYNDNGELNGDINIYEGTQTELIELANMYIKSASRYLRHVGNTILEYFE